MCKNDKKTDENAVMKKKDFSWVKYLFETLSIFIAVISAFTLNNWNQNRRDHKAEKEIVIELKNAVQIDLRTIRSNKAEYLYSKKSCDYLKNLINNKSVNQDSIQIIYKSIFDNAIFAPNKTGYDGLVTKGLGIVKDKLLRQRISYYYNYYFDILVKLEEHEQGQAHKNYYFPINNILIKNMRFNEAGELIEIKQPISISELDKKKLYSYLWMIKHNIEIKINIYQHLEDQMLILEKHAEKTIKDLD